jgi:hypothetical protein
MYKMSRGKWIAASRTVLAWREGLVFVSRGEVPWLLIFGGGALVFALPVLIGLVRGAECMDLIVLSTALGLVTGIGWLGAMVLACGMPGRLRPRPAVVTRPSARPAQIPWPFAAGRDDRDWPAAS